LVQPAEAKIVYTRVNIALAFDVTNLDLNNDGIPDFEFYLGAQSVAAGARSPSCAGVPRRGRKFSPEKCPTGVEFLSILPPAAESKQNQIWANPRGAYALPAAINIGGQLKFKPGDQSMAFCSYHTSATCGGNWVNAAHRYLGLKFVISGAVHYGWARLTVNGCCFATLTGYAYETIPNKSILTGNIIGPTRRPVTQIQAPDIISSARSVYAASLETSAVAPASLGVPALGADGLLPRGAREKRVSSCRASLQT
jgi:hypothetical protein